MQKKEAARRRSLSYGGTGAARRGLTSACTAARSLRGLGSRKLGATRLVERRLRGIPVRIGGPIGSLRRWRWIVGHRSRLFGHRLLRLVGRLWLLRSTLLLRRHCGSFPLGVPSTRSGYIERLRRYQPRQLTGVSDPRPSIDRVREHGVDDHGEAIAFRCPPGQPRPLPRPAAVRTRGA
jgi:hypothetical protein